MISILIPTKDEPLIQDLVNKINNVLKEKHEIIIIDKSSVTPKVRNAKIIKQKSDGLGNAILEGLKDSKGDIIITMDGDGSHRPEDLHKLIEKTNEFDIVIGSKYIKGGKTEDKAYRILISKIYCSFASLVLGLNIKDNMSGFAAIRRDVYNKISLRPKGFKINTEILYKAKKFGFKCTEVPIIFPKRKKGKSKGNIKQGLRTIKFILELRLGR